MAPGLPEKLAPYGSALALVLAAWLVRGLVDPLLGDHNVYGTFAAAVLIAAWFGGTGPAVAAMALGALVATFAFVPPREGLAMPTGEHRTGLVLLIGLSMVGILASRALRRAEARAATSRRQAALHLEELLSSEERFRHLAQSMPQIVWTAKPNGSLTFINQRWKDYTGLTLDQTNQLEHVKSVLHPEDAPRVLDSWRESLATGAPHEAQWRFRRRSDGAYRWFLTRALPIRDEGGRIREWLGTATDIDDQKRIEEELRRSERLYRGIGESIDYGIWVCDSEGNNVYASESFLRLVGLTQRECSELGWSRVLNPEDIEATVAAWKQCVRSGSFWEREHRFRGVDGEWHYVLARGVPIRDNEGRVVCWAGINLDIGALKKAQQDLKDADRRKDEFLATLAHELRNPLAPLCNGLELLRLRPQDAGAVTEIGTMMERQLSHLVRLVDDLLDVSRITRGKIELRKAPAALEDVVANALETIRPTVERLGHEVSVQLTGEPLVLYADPVRLAQVFSNLLDNACKYAEGPGKIRLTAERDGEFAMVAVKDSGIGIPPEALESVFHLFSQVGRSLERMGSGLGIGLSLVRRLVELHGGTVEARSEGPGRGSTFLVRLPLASVELPPRAVSEKAGPGAPAAHRVLVVDDNRDSAESLAMLLVEQGHEVRTAFDGGTALASAKVFEPSFILLDIGMPGLNGYEVARRMRDEPWGRSAVLIAMTGWGQAEDRRRSELVGFDAHLTKPVDLEALRAMLARHAGAEPRANMNLGKVTES